MITKQEALSIIRDALKSATGLWSSSAETLIFCTGLKETGYKVDRQYAGGPALGYWQMETATHDDIWNNYLAYRPGLASIVGAFGKTPEDLVKSPKYAVLMCRIKYLRDNTALPISGDWFGMAKVWKRVYNSSKGAGQLNAATLRLFKEGVEFVRNA